MIFFYMMMMIIIIPCNLGLQHTGSPNKDFHSAQVDDNKTTTTSALQSEQAFLSHRKLYLHGTCSDKDISISQSKDSSPGIPQFIVEIVNTCVSGCAPSHIHFHCGWFASARMVNPRIFKRLSYDDCLVNSGKSLKTNQIIRFTYSNSFMYPLGFRSAKFC